MNTFPTQFNNAISRVSGAVNQVEVLFTAHLSEYIQQKAAV